MIKVEIEVDQILTSAVNLEVEAGDRLLVMNGVIIGLVEKRAVRPTPTPTPTATPASRTPAPALRDLRAAVLSELRRHGPLNARAIAERLLLDKAARVQLKSFIAKLRADNLIEPAEPRRFPAYRLTNPAPVSD